MVRRREGGRGGGYVVDDYRNLLMIIRYLCVSSLRRRRIATCHWISDHHCGVRSAEWKREIEWKDK